MPYRLNQNGVRVTQVNPGDDEVEWHISVGDQQLELSEDELLTLVGLLSGAPAWVNMRGGWGINKGTVRDKGFRKKPSRLFKHGDD